MFVRASYCNSFRCLQPANYTKMEKADILEMTVTFLATLNRQKQAASLHKHALMPTGVATAAAAAFTPPPQAHRHLLAQDFHHALSTHAQQQQQQYAARARHYNATAAAAAAAAHARDYTHGYARCESEVNRYLSQHGLATPHAAAAAAMHPRASSTPMCSPSDVSTPQPQQQTQHARHHAEHSSSDSSSFISPTSSSTSDCKTELRTPATDASSVGDTSQSDGSMWRPW